MRKFDNTSIINPRVFYYNEIVIADNNPATFLTSGVGIIFEYAYMFTVLTNSATSTFLTDATITFLESDTISGTYTQVKESDVNGDFVAPLPFIGFTERNFAFAGKKAYVKVQIDINDNFTGQIAIAYVRGKLARAALSKMVTGEI